jgi:hypothetical protein
MQKSVCLLSNNDESPPHDSPSRGMEWGHGSLQFSCKRMIPSEAFFFLRSVQKYLFLQTNFYPRRAGAQPGEQDSPCHHHHPDEY